MLGGWSPRYTVPNPTLLNPTRCQRNFFEEGQSLFAPSTQVMEAVWKYEQLFLKPKTSVAVMIRSEHFIRSVGGLKKSGKVIKQSALIQLVDRHLKWLVTLVNELEGRFPGGKVFVTADVGTYGSFIHGVKQSMHLETEMQIFMAMWQMQLKKQLLLFITIFNLGGKFYQTYWWN